MATATDTPAGIAAMSRAVVSAAADLVVSIERAVVGDDKIRTARGNAWAAIQADRARAQARHEMDALVRTLLASGPRTHAATRVLSAAADAGSRGAELRPAEPVR
jgi:hypothetical protein